MARITVDQVALTDSRFQRLGRLYKKDRFWALGVMLYIWNHCQENETYEMASEELEDIHPDLKNLGKNLLDAQLATESQPGIFYIKGTHGRIEWLAKKRSIGRASGHLGGRPTKTLKGLPDENPQGFDLRSLDKTPPAPAPAPVEDPPYPPSSRGAAPFPYPMSKKEQESYLHSQIGASQSPPAPSNPCETCNKPYIYAKPYGYSSEEEYCEKACPLGIKKTSPPSSTIPPSVEK